MQRSRLRQVLLVLLATAVVTPAAMSAGAAEPGNQQPRLLTYENPLAPVVPGDGTVDSCADPVVLRGRQAGDPYWYMYCTTDPLNDEDVDAAGDFVFHPVPMMTSLDLVNWTYVGDALTTRPSWAEEDAAFWAPDVVYSSAFDTYYLFFVVTDTTAEISGVEDCAGDSAIGVATSSTATGPWAISETPVVMPRQNADGCDFFWTFDPDVLGDDIDTSSVLYYGSYYGGIFSQDLTLTATGAVVTGTATQVSIGDRYEGANVVYRGGYYYLFASATNCCASELTGYSVFVGRSTSPMGPFVDRDGHTFVEGRVGGTPVISMNGNRWVGTGHNTVFRDYDGQWWTVYHAVDRTDPVFAGTTDFTKRPALLDPLDWIDGWPTVRGGRWASDNPMPAPAAQPGQHTAYRPRLAPVDVPTTPIFADGFDGTELSQPWTWVREPDATTFAVEDGMLRWTVQKADLFTSSNDASVLVTDAPAGEYVVETKIRIDGLPADGCCFNYVQAGVLIYEGDDDFVKLTPFSLWGTRQTEFAKESSTLPNRTEPKYGNTVVGPPGEWTWLRIVKEDVPPAEVLNGEDELYTPYTSVDGISWVRGGSWTHDLGDEAKIGLVAMGQTDDVVDTFTAEFDYVRAARVSELRR